MAPLHAKVARRQSPCRANCSFDKSSLARSDHSLPTLQKSVPANPGICRDDIQLVTISSTEVLLAFQFLPGSSEPRCFRLLSCRRRAQSHGLRPPTRQLAFKPV
jgi:hypothetical protein